MRVAQWQTSRYWRGPALLGIVLLIALWLGSHEESTAYTTGSVARQSIESTVTAIGTLQPRHYVDVGAQVSGQITRLHVEPGDTVDKGQLLVEIDPSLQQSTVDAGRAELAGLRAELADQKAQHRLAQQQLARQRQLAAAEATREEDLQIAEANLASSGARIDRLEAQISQTRATLKADEARLGYTRIYAPMAGTVVSVDAREGQTFNATYQTPKILRIAELSAMTVWTEVSEADIGRVKPDMLVYFTTLGELGKPSPRQWRSTVRQLLPAPSVAQSDTEPPVSATRAVMYTVLFDVDNADGQLMPQMTAQVSFVITRAEDVLTVPLAALTSPTDESDRYLTRVMNGKGKPEERLVQVGVRNRHLAEIIKGLKEGEQVLTGERAPEGGLPWLTW
ncbi:MAG: efflux RND transporter periplasmic adaptor subunit [Parahaliea sp.]